MLGDKRHSLRESRSIMIEKELKPTRIVLYRLMWTQRHLLNPKQRLIQYGYYIYYTPTEGKKIKTDFGGAYIPLEFSLKRAIQFGKYLQTEPENRKDILPVDMQVKDEEIERYYKMHGGRKARQKIVNNVKVLQMIDK